MKTKTSFKAFVNMFTVIMITGLFIACSTSIKVTSDYDKGTDFDTYKTFQFVEEISAIPMNDLNKNRLLSAIEKALTEKGLSKAENADLVVDIQMTTRQEQSATSYSTYYGGRGRRGYGWGGGFSSTYTDVNTYIVGTLIINLVDNKENELIWQGVGEGTVDFDAKNREAMIEESVAKILYSFPPNETK